MGEWVVEAEHLSKRFGGFDAVRDVSLAIPRGSIYGVLGPNGAGKTTTIRMLLGVIEPDRGTRRLLGHDRPREVAARVGYLPEERGLYPAMTAREAVAFMGALRGLPLPEGRRRADERLAQLGLERAQKLKVRKLSKGMAQMVQLVGALVHDPELAVLDEPFSGLDPVNQERLEAMVLAARDRGTTVILSTHVMAHAQRLCDGLAIIAGGERRFEGTVAQARALLPQQVRYRPREGADASALAAVLPPQATRDASGDWHFAIPDGGVDPMIGALVAGGFGVQELAIERPGLHEAFVRIVGDAPDPRGPQPRALLPQAQDDGVLA